jgi:riboflavin synthase
MAVESVESQPDSVLLNLDVPSEHESLIVLHGSVAVDGVSLTVSRTHPGGLQLSLIEYTLRHTTLGDLKAGDLVNVETDMIGKHVQQMLLPFIEQRFFTTQFPDVSQLH